jgi:putative heme-binding domain-containing protein
MEKGQKELLRRGLAEKNVETAVNTAKALGTSADGRVAGLLLPVVKDLQQPLELRRQAVRALARSRNGAEDLIRLARAKELSEDLKAAAGAALHQSMWKEVKQQGVQIFPLPAGKNDKPLPPISELVKHRGSAVRGKALFASTGTCATCHIVNGAGREVGPDLSEIGKKLSREALYESILYPSASISHNYESYVLTTDKGQAVTGLLVSQTAEQVTLKGPDAIVRTFKKTEIEALEKSPVSLMPADLNKVLTVRDLADVVEYMLALKEAEKGKKTTGQ